MARRRKINYWKSRGGYGCWIDGVQHTLARGPDDQPDGPTYQAALAAYSTALRPSVVDRVGDAVTRYLAWLAEHRSSETHRIRLGVLRPFACRFDNRLVVSITRDDVTNWLSGRSTWGDTQRKIAADAVHACLAWNFQSGLTRCNPVSGLERGRPHSRGAEAYITPDTFALLCLRSSDDVRDLLVVLYGTGARPGEIRLATGKTFCSTLQALRYTAHDDNEGRHKTRRSGKERIILLSGEALDVVRHRVERFGDGWLFPSRVAGRMTTADYPRSAAVHNNLFRMLRERCGLTGFTSYSLRHSYCTDWLLAGKPVEVLAELIDSSPGIIRRHYQHLFVDVGRLRSHIEGFR